MKPTFNINSEIHSSLLQTGFKEEKNIFIKTFSLLRLGAPSSIGIQSYLCFCIKYLVIYTFTFTITQIQNKDVRGSLPQGGCSIVLSESFSWGGEGDVHFY